MTESINCYAITSIGKNVSNPELLRSISSLSCFKFTRKLKILSVFTSERVLGETEHCFMWIGSCWQVRCKRGGAHGEQWTELQPLKETMNTKEPIFDQREFLLEKSNIRSIPCCGFCGCRCGCGNMFQNRMYCRARNPERAEPPVPEALSTLVISFTTNSWSWLWNILITNTAWETSVSSRHSLKSPPPSRVRVAFMAFKSQREVWQVFKSFSSWSLRSLAAIFAQWCCIPDRSSS